MSISDLSLPAGESTVNVPFDAENKIYVQNFTGNEIIHGETATSSGVARTPQLIHRFPEVTIQINKSLIIDTYVKAYIRGARGDTATKGLNVAMNIKLNDTWYSLGNSGRVLATAIGGSGFSTYASKKFLDFHDLVGLGFVIVNETYTVQIELVGSCEPDAGAHITVGFSADVGGTFPTGETGVTAVADQNFTTVIIEETA